MGQPCQHHVSAAAPVQHEYVAPLELEDDGANCDAGQGGEPRDYDSGLGSQHAGAGHSLGQ